MNDVPPSTPPAPGFRFEPAAADDAEALVALRIAAMRDSLEQLGRFDPDRARDRFLATYAPAHGRWVIVDGARAGFVQLRPDDAGLKLDHCYITPAWQGRGIGSAVLRALLAEADAQALDLRLDALRGSASQRFYQRHGFRQEAESAWDIHYVRHALTARSGPAAQSAPA
jgi:GNAT superfamily N-acetyltransferase